MGPKHVRTDAVRRASPANRRNFVSPVNREVTGPGSEGIYLPSLLADDPACRDLRLNEARAGNQWSSRLRNQRRTVCGRHLPIDLLSLVQGPLLGDHVPAWSSRTSSAAPCSQCARCPSKSLADHSGVTPTTCICSSLSASKRESSSLKMRLSSWISIDVFNI